MRTYPQKSCPTLINKNDVLSQLMLSKVSFNYNAQAPGKRYPHAMPMAFCKDDMACCPTEQKGRRDF